MKANLVEQKSNEILDNITEGHNVIALSNLKIRYTFSMKRTNGEEKYYCQIGKTMKITSENFEGIINPIKKVKFLNIEL